MILAKILTILVALIEMFAIKLWLSCNSFNEAFHFSAFDVKLKVEEQVRNDVGYGVEIVRFFHNKAIVGASELLNKYLFFWETNFQALFFSLVGIFGIWCGFWYIITSKQKRIYKWVIVSGLLLLPFIEIFSISLPFIARLVLLWLPYALFSLYGLWQFLKHTGIKGLIIVMLLLALSVWYLLALQGDIFTIFCYNK
jgi:hypothetical protein